MNEVYEVKVPKEIVSWWREITAMEESHKEALNLGSKLIWATANLISVVAVVSFFGLSLLNIFLGLVVGFFLQ